MNTHLFPVGLSPHEGLSFIFIFEDSTELGHDIGERFRSGRIVRQLTQREFFFFLEDF